ncbi:phasin family protein [uncultured Methylobacterium sp.]|uniref:phasin family protein n=1 Tax=uncultured Methylobacterium sp. TaxID=157278 RepID=UPI0035CA6EB5
MNAQNNGSQALHDGRADGIPDAVKAGADTMRDKSIWPMPNGLEAAARQAREATEQFSRALGFSGEEGERLALQSKKNMEAVKQCRSVLTQAFQASSQSWMEMVQGQWKRNFDGMERLMHAKSVHEFGAIQGELVRENLEHILKDSRSIAEGSMQAADEAGKSLSAMTGQSTDEAA